MHVRIVEEYFLALIIKNLVTDFLLFITFPFQGASSRLSGLNLKNPSVSIFVSPN